MEKIPNSVEEQNDSQRLKRKSHDLGKENNGDGNQRDIMSDYRQISSLVPEGAESDQLTSAIDQVEHLHQFVDNPREQVADAGALLQITNTLLTSIKSHARSDVTVSDFISSLLRNYGAGNGSLFWKDLGRDVSSVFMNSTGCSTMLGPMETQLKPRKAAVRRKSKMPPPPPPSRPEELDHSEAETQKDTEINMATMFDILKEKRSVRLECLILNKKCFAQTVENLFALSFLVKDGRAEIAIGENNTHIVSPKNAPSAAYVASGKVRYHHFMFRFDFSDWKLMLNNVLVGEELMPHRSYSNSSLDTTRDTNQAPPINPYIEGQSAPEGPLEEENPDCMSS